MIKWLKNHFIPYTGNKYRPNIFSNSNTFAIVVLLLCFEFAFFVTPHFIIKYQPAAVVVAVLDELTNKERNQNNLSILKENSLLARAAEMKAKDMVTKNYFAHTSPEGLTPWHWLDQVGYKYDYAGENLAVNFNDTQDVTGAWMNSPTHRANIIKSNYTEMGSGVATGTYKGRESIFAVQIYANPVVDATIIKKMSTSSNISFAQNEVTNSSQIQEEGKVLGTTSVVVTPIVDERILTEKNSDKISLLEKLFISPRRTTNIVLISVLIFILLAFLLNIFVKVNIQYLSTIINGFIIIALIIIIVLFNISFSGNDVVIKSGIDYAKGQL